MEQKKGNKKWLLTLTLSLGAAALISESVSALTLDTSILRDIPYFQKLLITSDGDASSSAIVEFSGTNDYLMKLPGALGTDNILIAPDGRFSHTDSIDGTSITSGSLTTEVFAFDILSYSLGGAIGGFSDGACPAGEAITGFSGGVAICTPAPLISIIPSPLCAPGTTFAGWLGVGIPECSGSGGSFSAGGDDHWIVSSINPSDIYYSKIEGCIDPLAQGMGGLGGSYTAGMGYDGDPCFEGVAVGRDTPLTKVHVSSPSNTTACDAGSGSSVSTTVHGWVYTLGGSPIFPGDPSWDYFVDTPNCICLNPDPAYPGKCLTFSTGSIFLNGPMPSNPEWGDPCKQLYMSGGVAHLEYWSEGIEYVHRNIVKDACSCNIVPATGYAYVQNTSEFLQGTPAYYDAMTNGDPRCACAEEDPAFPGMCKRYSGGTGPYPSYPGTYIATNLNNGFQCKEHFLSGGVFYVTTWKGGLEFALGNQCEIGTGASSLQYNYSFVEGLPVGMRCPCDTDVNSIDAACSSASSFVQGYPATWIHMGTNSCYDFNLAGNNSVEHTLTVTYSSGGTPVGGTVTYDPLPNTLLPVFTGAGTPYPPAGRLVPRCSCDLDETTYDCVSFEMDNVGPHCMDVSSVFSYTGGSFAYTSFEYFPASLYVRGAISSVSYPGSSSGSESGTGAASFRVDNNGFLQAPYEYSDTAGGFLGYTYNFSRTISNPSGIPNNPRCDCDIDITTQNCGAGSGTIVDGYQPTGAMLSTTMWTCYDNYLLGGVPYYDAYQSPTADGTLIGYVRAVTSPVVQTSTSITSVNCSCDLDPMTEDCYVVHPTTIANELLGVSILYPPYDSPAVQPAVDFIVESSPSATSLCHDTFDSGGTTLYHTFGIQMPTYIPFTGASAPNAALTPPGGGAGVIGATTIPYNGANVFVIGSRVGINTETPFAAFHVVGNILFRSVVNPGYAYLAANSWGELFTTGSSLAVNGEQWDENIYAGNNILSYSGGSVGIGTDTPGARLHVNGDILTDSTYIVSDRNVKENINKISSGLNSILGVTGYTFKWTRSQKNDVGLVAQEIESIYPNAVRSFNVSSRDVSGSPVQGNAGVGQVQQGQQQGQQSQGDTTIKAVEYPNLLAAVISALKDLDGKMLNAGSARLAKQQDQIAILEMRIASLENGETWDARNPKQPTSKKTAIESLSEEICNGIDTHRLNPQNIDNLCNNLYPTYNTAKTANERTPNDRDLQSAYNLALSNLQLFFKDNGITIPK